MLSKDGLVEGVSGLNMYTTLDRRIKPRIICDYPAIVTGIDMDGKKYNEKAKLVNLSASGLFMWVDRLIDSGTNISVTVLLTSALIDDETPKLATNGTVVRIEPQSNGTCGIAVKFYHYRFQ